MNNEKLIKLPKQVEELSVQMDNNVQEVANLKTSKVDNIQGKGLSTNDYDNVEKSEVAKIKDKADINYVDIKVYSMANMGQDIKQAMTGGSVAVVGKDTVLTENHVDGQVTQTKLSYDIQKSFEDLQTLEDKPFIITDNGFYNKLSGNFESNTSFHCTEISVSVGDILYVSLRNGVNVSGVIFLDSNNNIVSKLYADGTDVTITNVKVVVPNGVVKARLSSRKTTQPLVIKKPVVLGKVLSVINKEPINFDGLNSQLLKTFAYKEFGTIMKPCVVFVDDDGTQGTIDYTLPLMNSKSIPWVSACWNDSIMLNSTNIANTLSLISSKKLEVALHYNNHINTLNASDLISLFDTELLNISNKGITVKNFIYPYNERTDLLQAVCGSYFNVCAGGSNTGGMVENTKRSNLYNMSRRSLSGSNTLSVYTNMIDSCKNNNQALIFYFHGNEMANSENLKRLGEVIDYCKSTGITITTLQGLYEM